MENQASKRNSAHSTNSAQSEQHRGRLLELAKESQQSPGVYLMKNDAGVALYVGKAKNLKNRLVTYFQSIPHESARTELMVSQVDHFDIVLTETEAEALILEATLIKKHKPRYNVRLKDDKAYPYLKIQVNDPFPRIEWTRRVLRDGGRYFGPFPSAGAARQVMQLLNDSFHLRDCSENTFSHRSRPCILHQMGKCTAPCVGLIDEKAYQQSIGQVVEVLEGRADRMIQDLRKGMEDASLNEEFELAAFYRDQIRNLEMITQTQGVFEAGSARDRDVVGIGRSELESHAALLRIRGGSLISVIHYHLQNVDPSQSFGEVLREFLSQYYLGLRSQQEKAERQRDSVQEQGAVLSIDPNPFPKEVLVPEAPEESDLLESTLGMGIRVAETAVDTQLLNVALANAKYALEQSQRSSSKGAHGAQALEEVMDKLHLQHYPQRIECYDVSNTQGEDAVASRVVFIDGEPDKNLYRRYKIRTVEGANDFAMMKEVLGRRFGNSEEALPDLIVVDGGKGQLAQAVTILEELSIQGVGVVGLAKARVERDFKAKEVESSMERIFIPNRKNPVPLYPTTGAYKLLTHVRDEAHRFAISYHRLLRSKRSLKTENE